jgi:hypothetical protein
MVTTESLALQGGDSFISFLILVFGARYDELLGEFWPPNSPQMIDVNPNRCGEPMTH